MARIPRVRLIIYSLIIVGLGSALVVAATNQAYKEGRFTPPPAPTNSGFEFDDAAGSAAQREPTPKLKRLKELGPDDIEDDDALLELNSLSSDEQEPLSSDSSKASLPTPVPSLGPTEVPDDDMIYGARGDDARELFSAAQDQGPPQFGEDGFIGGGRTSSNAAAGGIPDSVATPGDSEEGWVSGQPRGYAMLYAMQPAARSVVESNVSTLLSSRIREPYIGVLIDGTFTQDFDYLKNIISRLSQDRTLTVELYLTNGPTQRNGNPRGIEAPFLNNPPSSFRSLIMNSASAQSQFSAIAAQAREVFQFSRGLNPANQHLVSVMLEDNLDVKTYSFMRQLAVQQLDDLAGFIRSTCVGCAQDDREVDGDTAGDPREEHHLDKLAELKAGDGFTLDGIGFRYPGDGPGLGISSDKLKELITESDAKGLRFFGLWRHGWQGALESSRDNPHPRDRAYIASTPAQESFEIEMLRLGLTPEVSDNVEQDSGLMMR